MNKTTLILACSLLGSCAFGYVAQASLSDVPGGLSGKGYPETGGGGRFQLSDRGGRLLCDGQANPPSRSDSPGYCAGESGDGIVRCSDGRTIPFAWQAITCRSLKGSGMDQRGNRLEFIVERR